MNEMELLQFCRKKGIPASVQDGAIVVEADLDLSGLHITSLPDTLKSIKGSLNLQDSHITSLPDNLSVERDLNVSCTGLAALPAGLYVGGDLDVFDTPAEGKVISILQSLEGIESLQVDTESSRLTAPILVHEIRGDSSAPALTINLDIDGEDYGYSFTAGELMCAYATNDKQDLIIPTHDGGVTLSFPYGTDGRWQLGEDQQVSLNIDDPAMKGRAPAM